MKEYKFNGIQVIEDDSINDPGCFDARRPYYRLRGPKVTEQQAFEIIRRTDHVMCDQIGWDKVRKLGFLGITHFDINWFRENCGLSPCGWCRPDGIIGYNSHTGKLPDKNEILCDLTSLAKAFPFLDIVIAMTDWDEVPPYVWEMDYKELMDETYKKMYYTDYPDFLENVKIGFWVHNGLIEVLSQSRAQQLYKEYEAKYTGPDKEVYVDNYYWDHKIFPANYDYLRRCIAAYGVDPDEALKNYPWKDWLNGDPDWREKYEARYKQDQGQDGSGMDMIDGM